MSAQPDSETAAAAPPPPIRPAQPAATNQGTDVATFKAPPPPTMNDPADLPAKKWPDSPAGENGVGSDSSRPVTSTENHHPTLTTAETSENAANTAAENASAVASPSQPSSSLSEMKAVEMGSDKARLAGGSLKDDAAPPLQQDEKKLRAVNDEKTEALQLTNGKVPPTEEQVISKEPPAEKAISKEPPAEKVDKVSPPVGKQSPASPPPSPLEGDSPSLPAKRPSPWRQPKSVREAAAAAAMDWSGPATSSPKAQKKKTKLPSLRKLFQDSVWVQIPMNVTADLGVAVQHTRAKRLEALRERFPDLKKAETSRSEANGSAVDVDDDGKSEAGDKAEEQDVPKKRQLKKLKHVPQRHEYGSVLDYLVSNCEDYECANECPWRVWRKEACGANNLADNSHHFTLYSCLHHLHRKQSMFKA